MITRKDVMPVNFLKKEKFTGSDTGMRYRMEMTKREVPKEDGADGETVEETVLTGTIWIRRNAGRGEDPRGISIFGRRNCERGRVAERAACAVCEARKIDGCVNRKSEKVE